MQVNIDNVIVFDFNLKIVTLCFMGTMMQKETNKMEWLRCHLLYRRFGLSLRPTGISSSKKIWSDVDFLDYDWSLHQKDSLLVH